MAIQVTVTPYYKGSTTYYRYSTPYIGKRFASGSFAAEKGMTAEQARERAVQTSARYLNLPLYEFEGYELTAPSPEVVGQATYAAEQQAEESRARQAALHERREALRSGYTGEFKTEYAQRIAASPIGTPIPTQQEFMKVQQLQTGRAAFKSQEEFRQVSERLTKYGQFAGVSEFKAQIIQPPAYVPPPAYTPPYIPQDQRPFAGYKRPDQPIKAPYEGFALSSIYQRLSGLSRSSQASVESILGYSEKAHPVIKVGAGFAGVFTGLPEYFGGAALGAEYTLKTPPKSALSRVSPLFEAVPGAMKTGEEIVKQIEQKPFESLGMGLGLAALGRAPKVTRQPAMPKQISIFEPAKGVKITPSAKKVTTWNLEPTPEYIRAKFGEMNVFRGGDIAGIAKSLKTSPTSPRLPPQIRPMGVLRHVQIPKQISASTPIKGLTITEIKPVPSPKGTEVRMGQGLVQIQRQKTVQIQKPKVEVIQAPKAISKQAVIQRARVLAIPVMGVLTRQKASAISAYAQRSSYKTSLQPLTRTSPTMESLTKQQPIQISTSIQKQMPLTKQAAATIPKMAVRQVPGIMTKTAAMAKVKSITMPKTLQTTKLQLRKVQKQKSIMSKFERKGGRRKDLYSKFGELAKIATPKQIIRGLK